MLLWGSGGQVWALCGNGAELGGATLGLVRLGGTVGDQQRYSISFNANVHSAVWLGDLRFLLGAEGHSAVVDLGRSSMVRREDWIESPPSPRFLVAQGGEVIVAGSDRTGVRVFLHRVDLAARTTSLVAQMQLNRVQGLGVTAQGRLLLLGDVRGNSQVPRPVIVEVSVGSGSAPRPPPARPRDRSKLSRLRPTPRSEHQSTRRRTPLLSRRPLLTGTRPCGLWRMVSARTMPWSLGRSRPVGRLRYSGAHTSAPARRSR